MGEKRGYIKEGGFSVADTGAEYTLNKKKDVLVFRTSSYKAEAGSFLHSGIYNRELTSSLVAGGVLIALAIAVIAKGVKVANWHYLLAVGLFAGLFIFFRMMVFYEDYLETTINRKRGYISIFRKGFLSKRRVVPFAEMEGFRRGYTAIAPENPDGIAFVEKVALQHGTVIPGFGEVKEFYTVNVELRDGETVMVFSSRDSAQARLVLEELRQFAGPFTAQHAEKSGGAGVAEKG